jgi:sugar (pentulose or hexulose) kinase
MNAAIGIDYGTNSVRAIVADVSNGNILGSSVFNYPYGHQGVILDEKDPHLARQNPKDHITGLETSVKQALSEAARNHGLRAENVVGIGVDTTGPSPIPVDSQNTPLALQEKVEKKSQRPLLALEGPHLHPGSRTHYSDCRTTPSALHRQVRQHLLLEVVLGKNLALPQHRPGSVPHRLQLC